MASYRRMNTSNYYHEWYCVLHWAGESTYVYKQSKLRIEISVTLRQHHAIQFCFKKKKIISPIHLYSGYIPVSLADVSTEYMYIQY